MLTNAKETHNLPEREKPSLADMESLEPKSWITDNVIRMYANIFLNYYDLSEDQKKSICIFTTIAFQPHTTQSE